MSTSSPDPAGATRAPDGRSQRWAEHREARRIAIVEAGLRSIEHYGIDVGVHQIARSAHVSRTVLYRYFSDKDDLTEAMARRLSEELLGMIVGALEAQTLPSRMIEATVETIALWVDEHPGQYQYLRIRSSQGGQPLENLEASVAESLAALLNGVLSWLGGDPVIGPIASQAIVGMVEKTLSWWVAERPVPREELCAALNGFITDAISGYLRRSGLELDLTAPLPADALLGAAES